MATSLASPPPDSEPDSSAPVPALDPNPSAGQSKSLAEPQTHAPAIYHLSFNQDNGCFAAGLDNGFRIYNTDPFRPLFRRDLGSASASASASGGVGLVAMLYRCNILALVGGGLNPIYSPNNVVIWDDHQSGCIGELSFRSEVKSVKLRRDRIIVVLLHKIFVYNFANLELINQIETVMNPKGLCEVSNTSSHMMLVCLGLQKGQVRVENYGSKRTKYFVAHDSRIACMAITNDGRLLATASTKGTLIRVFNAWDGSLLQEVRRGADRAEIYSLAFSSTARWLAVSSDKGTVHVFRLDVDSGSLATLENDGSNIPREPSHSNGLGISSLSILKGVLPKYFSSQWSVAQFRLPEGLQHFVAFGHRKNTVLIIGMDGSFYRCEYDPVVGGEMAQLEYYNFVSADNFAKPGETFLKSM